MKTRMTPSVSFSLQLRNVCTFARDVRSVGTALHTPSTYILMPQRKCSSDVDLSLLLHET